MRSTVYIRRAERRDWEAWLRMRSALWPDYPAEELRQDIVNYEGSSTEITFVAVRLDGDLGGFLEVSLRNYAEGCSTKPVGYIEGWYVEPDLRGMGTGKALVAAAEEWAIEQGCREMASDCLIDNQASIQAHLALGYHETERLIHFCKRLG